MRPLNLKICFIKQNTISTIDYLSMGAYDFLDSLQSNYVCSNRLKLIYILHVNAASELEDRRLPPPWCKRRTTSRRRGRRPPIDWGRRCRERGRGHPERHCSFEIESLLMYVTTYFINRMTAISTTYRYTYYFWKSYLGFV